MAAPLAEQRRIFNYLQMATIARLTSENKAGTLVRPSSAAVRPAQRIYIGALTMLGPILNLLFLGCFWVAGSLALRELYDNRGAIITALSGRGGVKRPPRCAGV
jgi:hypothetical protein